MPERGGMPPRLITRLMDMSRIFWDVTAISAMLGLAFAATQPQSDLGSTAPVGFVPLCWPLICNTDSLARFRGRDAGKMCVFPASFWNGLRLSDAASLTIQLRAPSGRPAAERQAGKAFSTAAQVAAGIPCSLRMSADVISCGKIV